MLGRDNSQRRKPVAAIRARPPNAIPAIAPLESLLWLAVAGAPAAVLAAVCEGTVSLVGRDAPGVITELAALASCLCVLMDVELF